MGLNILNPDKVLARMHVTAFKFRLYPRDKQEKKLCEMIETGRRLWNEALAHRKSRWEEQRLSTSYPQQCWILTAERKTDSLLGELYSQAGQEILNRLDKAFEAFFEHFARYPRFKTFIESVFGLPSLSQRDSPSEQSARCVRLFAIA